MAEEDNAAALDEKQALAIQHIENRLELLDQRLDNIDSIVTAVAERVMRQLITLNITCPHCGQDVEIAIAGNQKPGR